MADENQQVVVTDQNADEEVKVDPNISDDSAAPEQVGALKKGVQTLSAQKKYWRDKAIDPETKRPWADLAKERTAPKVVQANPIPPASADESMKKDVEFLKTVEEKRSFGHANGLSPEAVDNVFSYAQGRNIKPEDALKDDFVKSGLTALKAKERLASSVPGPSSRSTVVGGKTFGEMKPEDRRANWGKMTGAER